jgi:hypothetical protein
VAGVGDVREGGNAHESRITGRSFLSFENKRLLLKHFLFRLEAEALGCQRCAAPAVSVHALHKFLPEPHSRRHFGIMFAGHFATKTSS